MADTVRTFAALQSLLANNTSGDISPQDLRDMLASTYNWVNSVAGGGGDISFSGGKVGIGGAPTYTLDVVTATAAARIGRVLTGAWPFSTGYAIWGHSSLDLTTVATNYALLQGTTGDTCVNAAATKSVSIRINNGDCLVVDSAGKTTLSSNRLRLTTASDALANNAAGSVGDIAFGTDTNKYLYIWFATNTPSRVKLDTW